MRSSFVCVLENEDEIYVLQVLNDKVRLSLGMATIEVTNAQMLDLGMKIQSVVNAIDSKNRLKDDKVSEKGDEHRRSKEDDEMFGKP